MTDPAPLRPPTGTLLKETRVVTDALSLVLAAPWALALPRGSGQTVMVLPGYLTSDRATVFLRGFLRALGYSAVGWGLGTNRGNVEALLEPVGERVVALAEEAGAPVALVGWSLGGVLAREAARDFPDLVSRVITLGTPVVGGPRYTIAAGAFAKHQEGIDAQTAERARRPIEVPITAIYTETDGVVAWRACIDQNSPRVEHVRVPGSHLGLGINARVWSIVARRLAGDRTV